MNFDLNEVNVFKLNILTLGHTFKGLWNVITQSHQIQHPAEKINKPAKKILSIILDRQGFHIFTKCFMNPKAGILLQNKKSWEDEYSKNATLVTSVGCAIKTWEVDMRKESEMMSMQSIVTWNNGWVGMIDILCVLWSEVHGGTAFC